MSKQDDNKALVGRWFTEFWGKNVQSRGRRRDRRPGHVAGYRSRASPWPRRHQGVHQRLPRGVPDLNFWGTADLIAEGDNVVGQWEGGGTHAGPAFKDFLAGSLPAATGHKMHFSGTTMLKVIDGRIAEEIGLDDGVTALNQLGLLKAA